jgi:hypothetical protein
MKRTTSLVFAAFLVTICTWGQNPIILSCLEQVKSDSIRATMEHLQSFGTRYALAGNRKDIAIWMANRFSSFGYPDVKLDSFQVAGNDSSYWQYNVVCTITGASSPGEICIIGGHYDSYCEPDPFIAAPGADDNGSAVAATLETARVMKLMNFQPESTIRFILFAAEELGLSGAYHQANESIENGEDVRLVFNMDMISSNPDSVNKVFLFRYRNVESTFNIASDAFRQYTNLSVFPGLPEMEYRSDSYAFWMKGFPATWAFEYDFCPNYHTVADIVSNCNMEYCAEITKGALATIMEMQFRPFPPGISSKSSSENVTIRWKPTENKHLSGYKVYRSGNDSAGFVQINSELVTDTFYVDQAVETRKDYYYLVRLVNDLQQESAASNTVHGVRFGFTDTLLVVACMKGQKTTPDSIRQFYASVLDSIPFRWFDLNQLSPLTLGTLSQYRNTLWVINSLEYNAISDEMKGNLQSFFENNGNMMFAGFSFSRFINGSIGFPYKHPESSIGRTYFKVDSTHKAISSYMYQAYPDEDGYDTLRLDPAKAMKAGYPGELNNIEVFIPGSGGNPIYRFDSRYDPGTPQGSQQDKIVGVEYLGDDFKTILLSFPLYYLDTSDARALMKQVIRKKFGNLQDVPSSKGSGVLAVRVYPNPSRDAATLSFSAPGTAQIRVQVYNLYGTEVIHLINQKSDTEKQSIHFSTRDLPSGMYFIRLQAGNKTGAGKIMVVK